MKLTTFGIDLAKNVFQVHGTDEHGKVLVKKQLRRDQMATFFVNLPHLPCIRIQLLLTVLESACQPSIGIQAQ